MKHLVSILETFIILTSFNFLFLCSTEVPICEKQSKRGFKGCCANYKWNDETQKCEECLPGYSGVNCSQSCPYPFYGDGCQEICECDNDTCDISTGCRIFTTGGSNSSLVSNAADSSFIESSTISITENYSTDDPVRRRKPSSVNDLLLSLVEILGCADLLLICAHFFVCIHDRRNRTDTNSTDTTVNYHRTSMMYENVDINYPSTSGLRN